MPKALNYILGRSTFALAPTKVEPMEQKIFPRQLAMMCICSHSVTMVALMLQMALIYRHTCKYQGLGRNCRVSYSSFNDCDTITFLPKAAPALPKEKMDHLSNGTLCYPKGADYAAWKEEFKGWKFVEI